MCTRMLHVEMPVKDEATTQYRSVEWYTTAIRNSPQMTPSRWARLKSSSVRCYGGKREKAKAISRAMQVKDRIKILSFNSSCQMREARVDGWSQHIALLS